MLGYNSSASPLAALARTAKWGLSSRVPGVDFESQVLKSGENCLRLAGHVPSNEAHSNGAEETTMSTRTCVLALFFFSAICSSAQNCQSGDCQTGVIAGPFSAPQVAEFSSSNAFAICTSSGCTKPRYWNNGIEGIDAQQSIGTQYQFYDQDYNNDANIAVGPTVSGQKAQILEWVNNQFVQAFDKKTGQPIFTFTGGTTAMPQSVISLWSNSTQSECRGPSGNVQVIFDRLDNEFVISRHTTFSVNGISHYAWCIAASSASDLSSASTQWYAYEYIMDSVIPCLPSSNNCTIGSVYYYYPDWPRIGTWSDGFYVTFDLTDPAQSYFPAGFEACQFDRADIAQGKASKPIACYTYMVPSTQEPSLIHSVDVADVDSATGPPSGEPQYFVSIVNPSDAQQSGSGQLRCTSQSPACTSNQLALFNWGATGLTGPTFETVKPYTPGCYDTSSGGSEINTVCVPEPSTSLADIGAYGMPSCYWFNTPCVDSLGDRIANRLNYNHLATAKGPNGEYLTASHVVMESTSDQRTGIRYYILQVSNGTASVLVNSGGTSAPPDLQDTTAKLFYYMPSAALDAQGNLAFTYASSGKYCFICHVQRHPAINFAVLPWMASTFSRNATIVQGTKDEQNSNHWGEYAATVLDSTNGLTFYGIGEYFTVNQSGTTNCKQPASDCLTWRTRIFRERVAP